MSEPHLMLVVLHNVTENAYSISAHNQTPEEAARLRDDWTQHFKPGFRLLTLEQARAHNTAEADACRVCREIVRRSSSVDPLPKFQRRN